MSFASVLDKYCIAVDCTNHDLAELCGISPSAVSRYRRGERTPEAASDIAKALATGLATLSEKDQSVDTLSFSEIYTALETELAAPHMVGMDFHMRLDALMSLSNMRNTEVAEVTGTDPSYVSRIRRGQRSPANISDFVRPFSHLAARRFLDRDLFDDLAKLVEIPDLEEEYSDWDIHDEEIIADIIEVWLTGGQIVEADITKMKELLTWFDKTDFSSWLHYSTDDCEEAPEPPKPLARFYYGLGGMRSAELDFLSMAAKHHVCNLLLSSDMPLLKIEPGSAFLQKYRNRVLNILRQGAYIQVIYNVERPLEDTIRSLRMWSPLYMTGRVTPHFLQGLNTRLFYHMNYVCDICALSSEAVVGHEEDGRYYLTTRPEDVSYFQKKIGFVMEKAPALIHIYRSCDPEQQAFEAEEAQRKASGRGRQIGKDEYHNVKIISYPNNCTVISIPCGEETVHFVIKHPKINYVISRM